MRKQVNHYGVTPEKYKAEFPWLKEVDSLALANAQMNLQSVTVSQVPSGKYYIPILMETEHIELPHRLRGR